MNKVYTRIDWENYPSINTPINESNLNKMDAALDEVDNRVISLDTSKATKTEVATLVADVRFDESTGVITVTKKNGSTITIDTKMEKIAVNFTYDSATQQIILTLIDGTKQYIDLSALITQYEFLNSDTITFVVQADGKIKAEIPDGSITESKLQPNYLAQIKVETAKSETYMNNASQSATQAKSYAVGGTGTRTGEDTDNAKYYYEQAKMTDIGQLSEEVAEINSNLSQLEYSDVAGGKNLFNGIISEISGAKFENGVVTNTYTDSKTALSFQVQIFNENTICLVTKQFIATENARNSASLSIPSTTKVTKLRIKHNGSSKDIYIDVPFTKTGDFTISIYVSKNNPSVVGGLEFSDIQIEEGNVATPYEPYIPSVKMLAEEVSAQNKSLEDYGLDNKFDGNYKQGYRTYTDGQMTPTESIGHIYANQIYNCKAGDTVRIVCDDDTLGNINIVTNTNNYHNVSNTKENEWTIPSGVTQFSFYISKSVGITPSTAPKTRLYINNEIDELKNDLVNKELPVGSVVMIFAESATPVFAYGTWNKMNTEPYSFDTSSGGAASRIAVYFYRRIS